MGAPNSTSRVTSLQSDAIPGHKRASEAEITTGSQRRLSFAEVPAVFFLVLSNSRIRGSTPFLEFPSLEDAIVFRSDADRIMQGALNGDIEPVPQPPPEAMVHKGV